MTPYRSSPYGPGHRPVWTPRRGNKRCLPHTHTTPDVYALVLDEWIGTLRVQIGTGDIVKQHTRAIVNPANNHLNHFGGAARAIADVAGINLPSAKAKCAFAFGRFGECEAYKLRPRIEYDIHTVGPRDVDYSDKDELQTILTKTYYSVIKYASEILRIPTLCIPAISSGIFQVKLKSVVRAFYMAVTQYVDEYSRTSHTPILQSIRFISNC